MLIELLSPHRLTVIVIANARFNCVSKRHMKLLQHDRPCRVLLLLINRKRTTVESEIGINLLDQFGEDTAFVVVWFVDGIGRSVEESVLFA